MRGDKPWSIGLLAQSGFPGIKAYRGFDTTTSVNGNIFSLQSKALFVKKKKERIIFRPNPASPDLSQENAERLFLYFFIEIFVVVVVL